MDVVCDGNQYEECDETTPVRVIGSGNGPRRTGLQERERLRSYITELTKRGYAIPTPHTYTQYQAHNTISTVAHHQLHCVRSSVCLGCA